MADTSSGDLLVGDYLGYQRLLDDEDRAKLLRVRAFLTDKAAPIVDDHWMRGEFPHELVPGLAELDIVGIQREGAPGPTASRLLIGFLALELARCDPSLNSFIGIQAGLAMGSIDVGGDDEQRQRWLPSMARLDTIGAFGLTEPHGGSDVAGGLETTARRDGDEWILNGAKRWIGNATFADLVIIWARVADSDTIHGFVVERGTPGVRDQEDGGQAGPAHHPERRDNPDRTAGSPKPTACTTSTASRLSATSWPAPGAGRRGPRWGR